MTTKTALDAVITLLDDIAYARGTSVLQEIPAGAELDELIRDEHPEIIKLTKIRIFLKAQKDPPADIGMRGRLQAEQMAEWCRDLIDEEVRS